MQDNGEITPHRMGAGTGTAMAEFSPGGGVIKSRLMRFAYGSAASYAPAGQFLVKSRYSSGVLAGIGDSVKSAIFRVTIVSHSACSAAATTTASS